MLDSEKQIKAWIRSQHLICEGSDFIFETVDQTQLEKFERCIELMGSKVRTVKAVGNWPMGPNRSFKVLRAIASVPRPGGEELVTYWAKKGSQTTRYSEINT
jgi:phycoerythrin-associated linker protein